MNQTLDTLAIGEIGFVERIENKGSIRRRLLDIGITSGCKIKCILKSPSQDPVAYLIRGAMIAIRKEDARHIIVRKVNLDE